MNDRQRHHQISPQLALGMTVRDDATFDNFTVGANAETVAALKLFASGVGERFVFLCGARGQGSSHLLQACCHQAATHQLSCVYLPLENWQIMTPDVLNGLESLDLICIDDLHRIAGEPVWEEAVFHLYNRVFDAGGRIVMAANDLPSAIGMQLPDLISRLSWGMVYQLHPLSDEEKLTALITRAYRRGITLSEEVGKYLLTHCPRHMGVLFTALATLENASLAAKRRLTIPFVKEVLQI